MEKKVKSVMATTEKANHSIIKKHTGKLFVQTKHKEFSGTKQHLYFISDDEPIKEGDWCYHDEWNKVVQCTSEGMGSWHHLRKVIASTDLLYWKDNPKACGKVAETVEELKSQVNLPQIPESFIKAYVEANGIDEVMVEYEADWDDLQYNKFGEYAPHKPKLTDNNEVIISMVEEKDVELDMNLIYSKIGGCLRNEQSDYAIRVVTELMENYAHDKTKKLIDNIKKLKFELDAWKRSSMHRKSQIKDLKAEKVYSEKDMYKAFMGGYLSEGGQRDEFDKWIEESNETGEERIYTKKELPKIILSVINDLENQEYLTNDEMKIYVTNWVNKTVKDA